MSPFARSAALIGSLLFLLLVAASASESDHKYQVDEPVTLWVNKVGPYNNPQEIYNYYSLPFCQPARNPAHKWGGLGEVLGGNELIDSQIEIKYQKNVDKVSICAIELDAAKVKQFEDAIENSYWLEFFVDRLPLWGFVGEVHPDKNNGNKHYLFTHKDIIIKYNGDHIIQVNLTQGGDKPLEVGRTLDMTYSVKWIKTDIPFVRRFDVYLDYPFFEHQIHWFSIFNSFMMVMFLTGLVSIILMRTLRNDYAKYAREDDDLETMERDVSEESGWKLVHGDVFRPPSSLVLLSALVGIGAQLALLVLLVILLAIIGMLYIGTIISWMMMREGNINEVSSCKRQINKPKPVAAGDMEEIFHQAKQEQEKHDKLFEEEQAAGSIHVGEQNASSQADYSNKANAKPGVKPKRQLSKGLVAKERNSFTEVDGKFLVPGSRVRVLSGPFTDYIGNLAQLDGKTGKATVGILMFGKEIFVEVEATEVVESTE